MTIEIFTLYKITSIRIDLLKALLAFSALLLVWKYKTKRKKRFCKNDGDKRKQPFIKHATSWQRKKRIKKKKRKNKVTGRRRDEERKKEMIQW